MLPKLTVEVEEENLSEFKAQTARSRMKMSDPIRAFIRAFNRGDKRAREIAEEAKKEPKRKSNK